MKLKRSLAILCAFAFLSFPPVALTQVGVVSRVSQNEDRTSRRGGFIDGEANGPSFGALITADGCRVGYASDATNLGTLSDTNGVTDLFIWRCDRDEDSILLSFGTVNVQANGDSSKGHFLGSMAEFVAFVSEGNNLVTGDNNGTSDIFVIHKHPFSADRVVTRVSVPNLADQGALGSEANAGSDRPSLGANNRFVVFESMATNLVLNDTNIIQDIFVHDRQTGETTRVSVPNLADQAALGTEANSTSEFPVISGNGRFIAFQSAALNLVTGDINGFLDIFVHDRQTGETTRVSVPNLADQGALGTQGNSASGSVTAPFVAAISADGRFVAFQSDASNLILGDTNGTTDIFVHDRQTGETTRVSLPNLADQGALGTQGNAFSINPSISLRGRYVAFASSATNLVTGDTNGTTDIFVHDRQTRETIRVSINGATQADALSQGPALSADGRFVAFESDATTLIADDTNAVRDVFLAETGLAADPLPAISAGGIVNGASFAPFPAPVAPGSIVSVFGVNLADATAFASATPLPTTLAEGGTSIEFAIFPDSIGRVDAPLFFVSSTQMNMQLPWETEAAPIGGGLGATPVLFGVGGHGGTFLIFTFAPGLFTTNQAGTGQGAILISGTGGVFAAPVGVFPTVSSRPVMQGEFIEIFCTGLGPVNNQPVSGAATTDATSTTIDLPKVTIGGVAANVTFSGLAPGFVGLYQVNVQVPAGVPVGNAIDVVLTIPVSFGFLANTVTIAVQ